VRKTDEWVVWGNVRVVKTERKSGENAKGERKRKRETGRESGKKIGHVKFARKRRPLPMQKATFKTVACIFQF